MGLPPPSQVPPIRNRRSPEPPVSGAFCFRPRRWAKGEASGTRFAFARARIDSWPPMRFRLATWNINSVRLRVDLVRPLRPGPSAGPRLPARDQCIEGKFPELELRAFGLPAYRRSRPEGLSRRRHPFPPSVHARRAPRHLRTRTCTPSLRHARRREADRAAQHLRAGGAMFPIRAQREIPPQARLSRGHGYVVQGHAGQGQDPHDRGRRSECRAAPTDVWSHKQLLEVVSHTPAEVARFERVQASRNWVDVMRRHVPAEEKLFTWWSYRNRDWRASNRGRRLDHIWTTPRSTGRRLDDRSRRGARRPRTSDHAPVSPTCD